MIHFQPGRPEGGSSPLEIDTADFDLELSRLRSLGVEVTTFEHRWCRWRSVSVRDPEENIVELVCYDETIE
jgi:hypothetical protein